MKSALKHTCRKGGKQVGVLDGPAWAAPGGLVKLADEDRWGRVMLRYRCCDSYAVAFSATEDGPAETRDAMAERDLEDAFDAYPHNLPPKGYMIPRQWPGTGDRPFGSHRED